MDERAAADKRFVVNFNVAAEQHVVRQDCLIANLGIVTQVSTDHQQRLVPENG